MNHDPMGVETLQPELFFFGETEQGSLELFPAVWGACEDLIAPELSFRKQGFDRLINLHAPRLSPLVAYLLATRVTEPDLELRRSVVSELADLMVVSIEGRVAPEGVRKTVQVYFSHIRQPAILALLEVGTCTPEVETSLATLFNACPEAGSFLVEILSDRNYPLELRFQAVRMIDRVGYLDTLPELEKLAARFESRIAGQLTMPFAPPAVQGELTLLEEIRSTLQALSAS